jgi:hypothetical protein
MQCFQAREELCTYVSASVFVPNNKLIDVADRTLLPQVILDCQGTKTDHSRIINNADVCLRFTLQAAVVCPAELHWIDGLIRQSSRKSGSSLSEFSVPQLVIRELNSRRFGCSFMECPLNEGLLLPL